ncbi:MAG: hypothetical protein ACT4PT_07795 [Methanobacteriota archaeon]
MTRKVYLCGKDGCCPALEFAKESVLIGEAGNLCKLSLSEWNELRALIRTGRL